MTNGKSDDAGDSSPLPDMIEWEATDEKLATLRRLPSGADPVMVVSPARPDAVPLLRFALSLPESADVRAELAGQHGHDCARLALREELIYFRSFLVAAAHGAVPTDLTVAPERASAAAALLNRLQTDQELGAAVAAVRAAADVAASVPRQGYPVLRPLATADHVDDAVPWVVAHRPDAAADLVLRLALYSEERSNIDIGAILTSVRPVVPPSSNSKFHLRRVQVVVGTEGMLIETEVGLPSYPPTSYPSPAGPTDHRSAQWMGFGRISDDNGNRYLIKYYESQGHDSFGRRRDVVRQFCLPSPRDDIRRLTLVTSGYQIVQEHSERSDIKPVLTITKVAAPVTVEVTVRPNGR